MERRASILSATLTGLALASCIPAKRPEGVMRFPTATAAPTEPTVTPTPELIPPKLIEHIHVIPLDELDNALKEEGMIQDDQTFDMNNLPKLPDSYDLLRESINAVYGNKPGTEPLTIPRVQLFNFAQGENGKGYGYTVTLGPDQQEYDPRYMRDYREIAARTRENVLVRLYIGPGSQDTSGSPEISLQWFDPELEASYTVFAKNEKDALDSLAPFEMKLLEK